MASITCHERRRLPGLTAWPLTLLGGMVVLGMKGKEPKPRKVRGRRGGGGAGVPMTPSNLPEDVCSASPGTGRLKAAPAPGVPMSIQEYERLKEQARTGPAPEEAPAQEDRPKPSR